MGVIRTNRQATARGQTCIDLGASPGGWSWVLGSLGTNVTAVDKAPLEKKIVESNLVKYKAGSMFAYGAEDLKRFEWVFSDAACEPQKLYNWVKTWIDKAPKTNVVCTLKFRGKGDYEIIRNFLKIPESKVMHLSANKHELTWYRVRG